MSDLLDELNSTDDETTEREHVSIRAQTNKDYIDDLLSNEQKMKRFKSDLNNIKRITRRG